MTLTYTVILTPEPETGIVDVAVPAMPGVLTWGATTEEALESAREAIELHLEGYVERGQPFPLDRRVDGNQSFVVKVRPPSGTP
jgi:antitoxin HicB